MGHIKYILIFLIILNMGLVMASSEQSLPNPVKKGDCISLTQNDANVSFVNITSIQYPNGTKVTYEPQLSMTKIGIEFNYSFCDTDNTGTFIYTTYGDPDGILTTQPITFLVTANGQELPSGIVITLFILFFIILLLFSAYIIIYSIGHAIKLDFDIIDLAWNYGLYFVLIGLNLTESAFLGNGIIKGYIDWAIEIGLWVLLILPTIYFILTLTIGTILSKRIKGVDY